MKIRFFAALKDFFGSELMLHPEPASILGLSDILIKLKPESEGLLKKCRFAINNTFVSETTLLENADEVLVMPPSSGG